MGRRQTAHERPLPADYAETFVTRSTAEIARHYRVSDYQAGCWIDLLPPDLTNIRNKAMEARRVKARTGKWGPPRSVLRSPEGFIPVGHNGSDDLLRMAAAHGSELLRVAIDRMLAKRDDAAKDKQVAA